jgi:hypothetical protein
MLTNNARRISSSNIDTVAVNEIFVFGSNLDGVHGAGAAKKALDFGAEMGNGIGRQGNTYALPTVRSVRRVSKNGPVQRSILEISEIKPYVDQFIAYAKQNPYLLFLVTEIGCGLAGYTVEEIAPLFKEATSIENIFLPLRFWDFLENDEVEDEENMLLLLK